MNFKRICPKCGKFGNFYSGQQWCGNCISRHIKERSNKTKRLAGSAKKLEISPPPTKKLEVSQPVIDTTVSVPTKDIKMKILWFYKYLETYDFDNWLHLKFVEVLKQYPGVELMVYGPDIAKGYPHLTTLPYDPKFTIDDIKKHFDFDAIVLNTKSRMFMHYDPHQRQSKGEWLPKGWCLVDKPKIMIEEDYHYETSDEWYHQNRIDLILQRHWSQSIRQQQVPMKWFPFSVDTDTFKPDARKREEKICFVGSTNPNVYRYRWHAAEALKNHKMIATFPNGQKIGQKYVKCLKDYVSHLSCSSTFMLTPAKMFEIMASGSALLTNENHDLPHLFPNGSYYTYKSDCSNIVHVASNIIADKAGRADVVRRGLEAINTRHSHQIRIGELINIINSLKSGK